MVIAKRQPAIGDGIAERPPPGDTVLGASISYSRDAVVQQVLAQLPQGGSQRSVIATHTAWIARRRQPTRHVQQQARGLPVVGAHDGSAWRVGRAPGDSKRSQAGGVQHTGVARPVFDAHRAVRQIRHPGRG